MDIEHHLRRVFGPDSMRRRSSKAPGRHPRSAMRLPPKTSSPASGSCSLPDTTPPLPRRSWARALRLRQRAEWSRCPRPGGCATRAGASACSRHSRPARGTRRSQASCAPAVTAGAAPSGPCRSPGLGWRRRKPGWPEQAARRPW